MEFEFAYHSESAIVSDALQTSMSFAPDTLREPTYFSGELKASLEFREAISALHDVVVSDLRWKPKDKTAYKAWRAAQEEIDWAQVAARRSQSARRIEELRAELSDLRQRNAERMKPFYSARQRYFDYLYKRDYDKWFVLDPVITVHPDEVFFECFSQDESSYGRLGVGYDVFQNVGEFECGTTNIDYSADLYNEFQKIRTYKTTRFEVDPSGFEVATTGEAHYKEVKIDLPDSWVRGFLQVSSAMSLPATVVELHPLDVHNICFILRRRRELIGPRSLRFLLSPTEPVRIIFDPWEIELVCPRSRYEGKEQEIRVWGRRRIHILERLIPLARRFSLHLLGKGMPYFFVTDLGEMSFTLGLSGWTTNDWSAAGNFDLLVPRAEVDTVTQQRVFDELKTHWSATPQVLADRLGLDRAVVLGSLAAFTQAGRAMWDLHKQTYRLRELSREPLPMHQLRFANEREQRATRFVIANAVKPGKLQIGPQNALMLTGQVEEGSRQFQPSLVLDTDDRITSAECNCNWHAQNKLRQGPCEHILALRLHHTRRG